MPLKETQDHLISSLKIIFIFLINFGILPQIITSPLPPTTRASSAPRSLGHFFVHLLASLIVHTVDLALKIYHTQLISPPIMIHHCVT